MKKMLVPAFLILVGLVLLAFGHRRAESVAGRSESLGAAVANAWDGKARQPDHVWYYGGGGALILIGAALALRRR